MKERKHVILVFLYSTQFPGNNMTGSYLWLSNAPFWFWLVSSSFILIAELCFKFTYRPTEEYISLYLDMLVLNKSYI